MADRDTVDADQLYKGKRFKVADVVEAINTDIFSNLYVPLRGGGKTSPWNLNSSIDDAHGSYPAGFHGGMRISLICAGHGDVTKTSMSRECAPAH